METNMQTNPTTFRIEAAYSGYATGQSDNVWSDSLPFLTKELLGEEKSQFIMKYL